MKTCYEIDCPHHVPGTLVFIDRINNDAWHGLAEVVEDASAWNGSHMYVMHILNGSFLHGDTRKLYCNGIIALERKH